MSVEEGAIKTESRDNNLGFPPPSVRPPNQLFSNESYKSYKTL